MLRHHGGNQNLFDGRGFEAYKQVARDFFAQFIDATFREQYARYTDIVLEYNEYLASSHTGQELRDRIDWARAAAWVWRHEYRTQAEYSHIRLGLLSCPVGNDIHRTFAEIALQYDCVLSYHGYDHHINGQRDPFSWRYHCGRWNYMEQAWGLKPDWMMGEAGPYAGVLEGWRHSSVLGGNQQAYVDAVRTWIREIKTTTAYAEGQVLGFNLFTTGGTDEWKHYETRQNELDMLAAMIAEEWKPVPLPPPPDPEPPPPPPPDPEPEPRKYVKKAHIVAPAIRRRLFDAVVDEAWQNKESVFFSVDDAALTARTDLVEITARTLIFWNVEQILSRPEEEAKAALEDFIETYYPEPTPTMVYRRLGKLFTADSWDFPLGDEEQRGRVQVPPEPYFDANPFLNHYFLGYHTGNDYNLPGDLDRNGPVYAAASGKVVYASQPSVGWQNVIIIRHQLPDGSYVYSRSAHLHEMFVKPEEWLKRGEMIGTTGRNWDSDNGRWGPWHLHYDISPTSILPKQPGHWPGENRAEVVKHYVDPVNFIRQHR